MCNMAKGSLPLETFMDWLEWLRGGKSFSPYQMTPAEVYDRHYRAKF